MREQVFSSQSDAMSVSGLDAALQVPLDVIFALAKTGSEASAMLQAGLIGQQLQESFHMQELVASIDISGLQSALTTILKRGDPALVDLAPAISGAATGAGRLAEGLHQRRAALLQSLATLGSQLRWHAEANRATSVDLQHRPGTQELVSPQWESTFVNSFLEKTIAFFSAILW
jgi:hypothetical protein